MIKLIAAIDKNNGIGYKNELLFRIKKDMKHFKDMTTGDSDAPNIVVMGRKTFESLPELLHGRINVVLTRNKDYQAPIGVFVFDSIEKIINHYNSGDQDRDIFCIGGENVYRQLLPYADEVHLTHIDKEAGKVDTYFPYEVLKQHFQIVKSEKHYSEEEECYYSFVTYKHK